MKNEVGNRYGKLLVISRAQRPEGRPAGAYWLCQCDCGNQKIIRGADLRQGHVNSCGCLYGQHSIKNEIGKKYGRLTVIKKSDEKNDKGALWICQCDCGNIITVTGGNLRSGQVKSCGCYMIDRTREVNRKDITGQKFGKLLALSVNEEESKKIKATMWNCQCDCGEKTVKRLTELTSGQVKSCGCLKTSFVEGYIEDLLIKGNINYIKEFCFGDLKTPRNGIPRFDFAIFNKYNELIKIIEYDGEQHFKKIPHWGGEEQLEYRQIVDEIKTSYCNQHNIPLLRIKYTYDYKKISLEQLINPNIIILE